MSWLQVTFFEVWAVLLGAAVLGPGSTRSPIKLLRSAIVQRCDSLIRHGQVYRSLECVPADFLSV